MRLRIGPVLVSIVAAVLAACGGGGSGSSGAQSNTGGTVSTGGSAPALTSNGTITAFGSVYVNGNHFDVSNAQITVDDANATELDLRVGQSAEARGTAAVGAGLARASFIEVQSRVIGPVAAVDTAGSSFVVLGQTVKVVNDTSFDPAITTADITGIHVADLVRVHGVAAADGSITARRIDIATAAQGLRVAGTVANVNTAGHTFKINALTVDYTTATLTGFAGTNPVNGDKVRAVGTVFNGATTTLTATRVARVPDPAASPAAGTVEREGLVTRFVSLTDFDIAGQKITTTAATMYRDGSSADVALNADVEAHGTVDAAGVLTAQVIDLHHHNNYALMAPITALDATAKTMTVMGTTVSVDVRTRLEDKSPARIRNLAFTDLRTTDVVAVTGYEDPVGSGKITAQRLERLPVSSVTSIAGPFTATTAPQFKVLGITVNAAPPAIFYANRATTLTSAQFFAQAPGRRVLVTGSGSAPLLATRVLLLQGDDD